MNQARRYLPDGLLAFAMLALGLLGTAPAGRNQGIPSIPGWAYALVITAALALAARRRVPMTVLTLITVAVCLYLLDGYPFGPILLSLAIAVYSVAAHRPLRPAAIAASAALVLLITAGLIGAGLGLEAVAPQVAWVTGPLAIGVTVRVGREQIVQSRRDEARRQADAERLRVAQEVHDVVGHGLAAIMMQADIALHLLPKQPDQAEAALTAISRTSRESLDELRATLGAVRRGDDPDDRAPAPGLARLDALIDRTRAVGVPVTVNITGPLSTLPAAVDLAAYRIVQESLTNVLRHAGPATASVTLTLTRTDLTVSITDTGHVSDVPADARVGHKTIGALTGHGRPPAIGSLEPDHTSSGVHPDHTSGDLRPDHTADGLHQGRASGGLRPDLTADGLHPDHTADGLHPDLTVDGQHPDLTVDGQHPRRASGGLHPDLTADGLHPDRAAAGQRSDLTTDGQRPDRAADGQRPDRAADGLHSDRASGGPGSSHDAVDHDYGDHDHDLGGHNLGGFATGHGLAGMRERVSALGGSLTAGPRPEGGFAVTAILPVRR